MIYAYVDEDGFILATSVRMPKKMDGWVAVQGTLPPRPIVEDDTEPHLMLVDGQLVWQVGKTEAEIEALRAAAYRDRVDPLTCHIQRMADMGAADSEIDALRAVRDATFYAIQREFPYS